MIIAGCDPGLSGAVAIDHNGLLTVVDIPTYELSRGGKNKREIDTHGLVQVLTANIDHIFIEQAGSMPGQGVSSVFSFGKTYGIIIGICAALKVPYTLVPPQRWKKALGVPKEKDGARARASQLLPQTAHQWPLKKHDGRAEAALICLWGKQQSAPQKTSRRRFVG
jgi:crossover junction endodeoxyribonuclease RuvC